MSIARLVIFYVQGTIRKHKIEEMLFLMAIEPYLLDAHRNDVVRENI